MALTLAPLLALPFAGLLIRRAGYRFDAWVLPAALGFHWLLIRGHGTQPVYLIAVVLFVLVAALAAFRGLGMERAPAHKTREGSARLKQNAARVAAPKVVIPPMPRVRTIPLPKRPPEGPVATPLPVTVDAQQPTSVQVPTEPISTDLAERTTRPPRDTAELLDRIEAATSAAQRPALIRRIRSSSETIAYLRVDSERRDAALGKARTTLAHAWGDQRSDGLLVEFDGVAPRGCTVLVVLCDVADTTNLLEESARDAARGSAIVIPTNLPGVKRLGDFGENDARWLARAVFVPLHLILGDVNATDQEAGHGESVTGRPG